MRSYKTDSVKTPGGISKSLLTPCRRVGLSRNWKRSSISPFVSPLRDNNSSPLQNTQQETTKRKNPDEDGVPDQSQSVKSSNNDDEPFSILKKMSPKVSNTTPSRKVERPPKRRSKILTASMQVSQDTENLKTPEQESLQDDTDNHKDSNKNKASAFPILAPEDKTLQRDSQLAQKVKQNIIENFDISIDNDQPTDNSKSIKPEFSNTSSVEEQKVYNSKQQSPDKPSIKEQILCSSKQPSLDKSWTERQHIDSAKLKNPNELTRECVVVIQKKLFKAKSKEIKRLQEISNPKKCLREVSAASQALFDSDSDDVPLSHINKEKITTKNDTKNDEDDFIEKNTKITANVKKLADKNTSTGGLSSNSAKTKSNYKLSKVNLKPVQITAPLQPNNTFDDDEDFDLNNKKTIIIKKTYEKVSKLLKAKSTGSITQRDIDEIKSRIETKKKLLLTKALTGETKELRGLIKQWQKGCQNAVMDLMELMKTKCPDKQNMDYAEMLQSLKIPAKLVGYDPENDCFVSPDDSSILLSCFNDC